jgi:hypothetical protein
MCVRGDCQTTYNSGLNWAPLNIVDSAGNAVTISSYAGRVGDNLFFIDGDQHVGIYNSNNDPSWTSDEVVDQQYADHRRLNGHISNRARTEWSYFQPREGIPPPPSEANHVLQYHQVLGVDPCYNHIFLTEEYVVIYTSTHMTLTRWSNILQDDAGVQHVLCEDKCLGADNVREVCNDNGYCVRETGECVCNFYYSGDKCEASTFSGPQQGQ